jgi:hypothetical protein
VTAVASGTATLSATVEGKTGVATVTVALVPVQTVTVSPSTASLYPGQTLQLTASARDSAGGSLTGRTVIWTSSDAAVASVSTSGLVTASAYNGNTTRTATITATSDSKSSTATVTVVPTKVAALSVSPSTAKITSVESLQLNVTASDVNGNVLTGRVFSWTSSDETIATVSTSGNVFPVNYLGNSSRAVAISATSDGVTASAAVIIDPAPVASVQILAASTSIDVGGNRLYSALAKDKNGNSLTGRSISWNTEATSIATVTSSGLVSGIAAGQTSVSASVETVTALLTVVIANPAEITTQLTSPSAAVNGPASYGGNGTASWERLEDISVLEGTLDGYGNGATVANLGSLDVIAVRSRWLYVTGFNFNIPSGSTIRGVSAELFGGYYAGIECDCFEIDNIALLKGGLRYGESYGGRLPTWTSPTWIRKGGNSHLWGTSLTVAEVNSASFGFGITAAKGPMRGVGTRADVDYLGVRVTYAPPPHRDVP